LNWDISTYTPNERVVLGIEMQAAGLLPLATFASLRSCNKIT